MKDIQIDKHGNRVVIDPMNQEASKQPKNLEQSPAEQRDSYERQSIKYYDAFDVDESIEKARRNIMR